MRVAANSPAWLTRSWEFDVCQNRGGVFFLKKKDMFGSCYLRRWLGNLAGILLMACEGGPVWLLL